MGKYVNLEKDVFSVFDSAAWKAESIKTFPGNFVAMNSGNEFLRVSIIPSGNGINITSISGIIIIDIFTSAGSGPHGSLVIADKLDSFLQGKTLSTTVGSSVQFHSSTMIPKGIEGSLHRASYTIPFNHFGV